jgi:hypothetical protein
MFAVSNIFTNDTHGPFNTEHDAIDYMTAYNLSFVHGWIIICWE